MIFIYRFIYFLLAPFALFFYLLFSKKNRKFLIKQERNLRKQKKKTFWFHASSGEFEHAKPLLRKLKKDEPLTPIVVTYSSTSYLKSIKNCADVDAYAPYPLDLIAPISQLIKTINPKIVLITKTDLWPEMLEQLKSKKIPTMIFARHENDKNLILKKLTYPLTYQKLTHISFVSESDHKNYLKIAKPKSFSIDGDPRVEEVFYKQEKLNLTKNPTKNPTENLTKNPTENLTGNLTENPTKNPTENPTKNPTENPTKNPTGNLTENKIFKRSLILGSIWNQDLKAIREPILELLKENKLKKLIIVPHEPTQNAVKKIIRDFKNHAPSFFSRDKDLASKIIVVDQIGHLFGLYSKCEVAFVGGSFKKKVHSILEPLSFGLPVLIGPYYNNNFEAKQYKEEGFVFPCKDGEEFKHKLKQLLESRPLKSKIIDKIKSTPNSTQAVESQIHQIVQPL